MRSCLYRVKDSRASSFTKSCKTLSGCNKHYISNSPRIKHLSPSFSYWPFLINTSSIDVNYFKCSLQKHRAVSELSTVPFTKRCTQTCCIYTHLLPLPHLCSHEFTYHITTHLIHEYIENIRCLHIPNSIFCQ